MDGKSHNWILVDYENVQAVEFTRLKGLPVSVVLFVGPAQSKVPTKMMAEALASRCHLEIVQLAHGGPNALDMVLAFRAGGILAADVHAHVHVLSKDRDYDTLFGNVPGANRRFQRVASFADLKFLLPLPTEMMVGFVAAPEHPTLPNNGIALAPGDRIHRAAEHLRTNARNRPKKVATLKSTLHALFAKKLSAPEIDEIFIGLRKAGVFATDEKGKVTYP